MVFRETTDTYLELGSSVYLPTFIVPLPGSDEFVWYSEKSGWGHLYLHDAATGEQKRALTSGEWLVRDVLGVDREGRELFFCLGGRRSDANPYFREVARVNLDTARMTLLSSGDDDRLVFSPGDFSVLILGAQGVDPARASGLSPGAAYYVETRQRPDRPNVTALMSADGEELMLLEEGTPNTLPDGQRWPEPFSVTGADGETDIRGVMLKPLDFDSSGSYPVIDYVYGGPQVTIVPKMGYGPIARSLDEAASLAELGFVVVIIDGPRHHGTLARLPRSVLRPAADGKQPGGSHRRHQAACRAFAVPGHRAGRHRGRLRGRVHGGPGHAEVPRVLQGGRVHRRQPRPAAVPA